jgi:hypothetical protein
MARSKIEAHRTEPTPSKGIGIARDEILADGFEDYAEQFEAELDDEDDFDVEEDIAFLGEEYDVLELDDVLELCNLDKRGPYRN